MGNQEFWQTYREEARERFPLVVERLKEIETEETVAQCREYFQHAAAFLGKLCRLEEEYYGGAWAQKSLEELQAENHALYEEILPENYGSSYANPSYAARRLGEEYGKMFSMLYADLRALIPYAFEGRNYELTIYGELLIEIYNCFEQEENPDATSIQQIIYWFYHDYSEIFLEISVLSQNSPEMDFYVSIIMDSELSDLRYLYRYGAYISENEKKVAEFLNAVPEETIQLMADTYTKGNGPHRI